MNATTLRRPSASLPVQAATFLVALALIVIVLPALTSPAAASTGIATTRGFNCSSTTSYGRRVTANPPQMTSTTGSQLQMVYWSPDLYRWTNGAWQLYDGSRPWYWAMAQGNGTVYQSMLYSTWFTGGGVAMQFVPYSNLPSGYYKVADYYRWGSTNHYDPSSYVARTSAWSYNRAGGEWCSLP
jgi:hypothetical protein